MLDLANAKIQFQLAWAVNVFILYLEDRGSNKACVAEGVADVELRRLNTERWYLGTFFAMCLLAV
ncbi:hypothetical protein BOTNAR_0148g00090 [Botryotinia narcissicola]|uniref:Uncharacterized protein n=1 Tax=Botryotinia narcissicola TaxID=278944 RepID=A0A4Z1IF56_9HELO|nr:hypothetical protein BOTNAR_0148g00090 [Botryotinia narcissicola]